MLQRKLVVPEVYDIMTRVQEMMVRSQTASIRQLCSSVLLQFLLDYPVGDKRLQQHLHFIITNLSYQHETGREAAIDMLKVNVLTICLASFLFMHCMSSCISLHCSLECVDAIMRLLLKPLHIDTSPQTLR